MGYKQALEAAGAEVISYGEFGDYQGSWYALVNCNANVCVISGSFGSCGGCDAFEGEFDYEPPTPDKLAAFGATYLNDPVDIDVEINKAEKAKEWDTESKATLDWLLKAKRAIHDKEFNNKLKKTLD